MSLQLDERQRAMLEAMHVRLWLPQPDAQRAGEPVALAAMPRASEAADSGAAFVFREWGASTSSASARYSSGTGKCSHGE